MTVKSKIESYIVNLDDYEVVQEINRGGFGCIYLIKNKMNHHILAAKVQMSSMSSDYSGPTISLLELSVLMRIQGPTIIRFYGFSTTDFQGNSNPTILMEYKENGSLNKFIELQQNGESPSEYDNTAKQIILCGIAHGMMTLHSHNVIHYDLKPGNVLLDSNLFPCITDFGLSDKENKEHMCGMGTAQYIAPEVIEGPNSTSKADVYSFGILMYEVLSGELAYSKLFSDKPFHFIKFWQMVLEGYRPQFNFPIKSSFKRLIEQCWSADPNERPTFKELFRKLSLSAPEDDDDLFREQLLKVLSRKLSKEEG